VSPSLGVEAFAVRLPAVRQSVTEGRHLMAAYLDEVGFPRAYDVCLALTEALSSAVRHAYRVESPGSVEVAATLEDGDLEVVVRDFSSGPSAYLASESVGIGLALMASLASRVTLEVVAGRGTELRLHFAASATEPR
jgi:anti-sigma regulatory factor (Ser/Thr protein kinase)